ncbi:MAG: hypothetical protein Q9173_003436 [Seirophora scorigena]
MAGYDGPDDDSDSIFGKVPEVRPLFLVDDLRPPPLRCGEKSLIEFLREGPPENCFHTPSPSLTAGSAVERSKSVTPKKSHSIGRSSLATVRRLLSMSPKQQDGSDRPKHIPIVTAQSAFTIPSPTSSSLSEQFSPWFTVSNSLMTPPLSRTTTNSAGPSTSQHELSAQKSFHHTETTSPTHNSRGASSSFGHSTHSSRSQIYGQPPAAMVSPVIPRKVTGEHLSLTSFPPVSKEDIAKLPKEIEPTLPSPEMSPFASRHHSRQTSLRHLSSNSPTVEAFPGLTPQTRASNLDTKMEDGRVFNLSAPPSAHQRPACCTYPIHTGESAHKSAETKIAANLTALARIQEDSATMIGSSFENPRPAPRPNSSSQAAARGIPKAVVTQSMAMLKSYFAICTPESIHAARIAISSDEERLERVTGIDTPSHRNC